MTPAPRAESKAKRSGEVIPAEVTEHPGDQLHEDELCLPHPPGRVLAFPCRTTSLLSEFPSSSPITAHCTLLTLQDAQPQICAEDENQSSQHIFWSIKCITELERTKYFNENPPQTWEQRTAGEKEGLQEKQSRV